MIFFKKRLNTLIGLFKSSAITRSGKSAAHAKKNKFIVNHIAIFQFIINVIMLDIYTIYLLENKKEANEPLEFKA